MSFEKQLINNIKSDLSSIEYSINDTITQKGLQFIIRQIYAKCAQQNYFLNIFFTNVSYYEPYFKQATQSVFIKTYNNILTEADKDKSAPIPPTKSQAADVATIQKQLQTYANDKTSDDEITLIVTSPTDFSFVTSDDKRIESKESLQKLDKYLEKNNQILAAKIKQHKQNKRNLKSQACEEAINKCISEAKYIKEDELKNTISSFIKKSDSMWQKVIKISKATFGDKVTDMKQYYYNFCLSVGYTIYEIGFQYMSIILENLIDANKPLDPADENNLSQLFQELKK